MKNLFLDMISPILGAHPLRKKFYIGIALICAGFFFFWSPVTAAGILFIVLGVATILDMLLFVG